MPTSFRLAVLGALLLAAPPSPSAQRGPILVDVERFATLPVDVRHPEGLAADPETGELYVGTFDTRMPESERNNRLLRYDADGRLLASYAFGATPLTGLAFADEHVYILNFGASKLQRLDARFDAKTPIEDVATFTALAPPTPTERRVDNPDGTQDQILFGASGLPGINGMVFDRAGNLYVSDSFQGAIYRIDDATYCAPCTVDVVSRDALLGTSGFLPFGVNGLAFDANEHYLYLTNAGDGRLLRMSLPAGAVQIVAESVHGADGLVFHAGLFWVSSNQADQVVAVDESGRVRVRAGAFLGFDPNGAPLGLLFPASSIPHRDWMVVTNLSLPITPAKGDEWEEETTRWTLARFPLPPSSITQGDPP